MGADIVNPLKSLFEQLSKASSFRKENFLKFLRIFTHPVCQICSMRLELSEKLLCGVCFLDLFDNYDPDLKEYIFEKASLKSSNLSRLFSQNALSRRTIEALFLILLSHETKPNIWVVYEDKILNSFFNLSKVYRTYIFSHDLNVQKQDVIFLGLKKNKDLFIKEYMSFSDVKSFREIYIFE